MSIKKWLDDLIPPKTAGHCKEHGPYHICACGMSHLCGTSNAEHSLTHNGYQVTNNWPWPPIKTMKTAWERVRDQEFNPWEAPAPECPVCYHNREDK